MLDSILLVISTACLCAPLLWLFWQFRRGAPISLLLPIIMLVILIFLGVNLKVFYLQFIRPDDVVALLGYTKDRMLQGFGYEVILPGLLVIFSSTVAFLVGYSFNTFQSASSMTFDNKYRFNYSKLQKVILGLLFVVTLSFVAHWFYEYFFISIDSSTHKRFNSLEGGATSRLFYPQYYLYKITTFVRMGVYLTLLYLMVNKEQPKKQMLVLLLVLYVLSVFVSSYFGNRAHVLTLLLDITFIFILARNFKLRTLYWTLVIIAFAVITLTTVIREGSRMTAVSPVSPVSEAYKLNINLKDDFLMKFQERIDIKSLSKEQKSKILLYQQCYQRIELAKMRRAEAQALSPVYWEKHAASIAPAGTGESASWIKLVDDYFKPQKEHDLCFGSSESFLQSLNSKKRTDGDIKLLGIMDRFLQGGYFIDVFKTSHLVRNVPKKIGYLNGQSIYGWMFAPIPPRLWPGKPLYLRMPPVLSTIIFNEPTNNIPPGIIAEMYINFGLTGLLLGMGLIGFLLRYMHDFFQRDGNSVFAQFIYAIIVARMTLILFNSSFGTTILKTGMDLLPLMLLLWYVLEKGSKDLAVYKKETS
jgi:hypothetical protein